MAKPDCKFCSGTGWIIAERDGVSSAARCVCVAEGRAEEMESRAQIPANYQDASFDSFILPPDNPIARTAAADAMVVVRAYATNFPLTGKPGLLLVGPPGTGKTHLAVSALRQIMSRGHEGLFCDYQYLLDRIRSGYNQTLGTSDREAYKNALEADVLLLDDLGAHRVTDWVEDTVTAIVTYRYNHKKPLIATTNLSDADMGHSAAGKSSAGGLIYKDTLEERIGPRARSRLFEMCKIVRTSGLEDYRMRPNRT